MKIVFDSEEQKNDFFDTISAESFCPSEIGINNNCKIANGGKLVNEMCRECWIEAIESEVKEQ